MVGLSISSKGRSLSNFNLKTELNKHQIQQAEDKKTAYERDKEHDSKTAKLKIIIPIDLENIYKDL